MQCTETQRPFFTFTHEDLARKFSDLLRNELTRAEIMLTIFRNRADPEARTGFVCHSHDFCDANMLMAQAIEDLTNTEFEYDPSDDQLSQFINTAWDLAKENEFYIRGRKVGQVQ